MNKLLNTLGRHVTTLAVILIMLQQQAWALTAANTVIRNQASATFKDDSGQSYNVTSNMVETLIQQVAGLELEQDQAKRGNIDGTVQFPHVLTNTGNGADSFDLTTLNSSGDAYDFDSITLYADLDQDGQPDDLNNPITSTPLLQAGEKFAFIAVVKIPATAADTDTAQLDITASSQFTPTQTQTNTDTVNTTNLAIVDVTKSMSVHEGSAGSGPYTVTLSYINTSSLIASQVTLIDALPAGMSYVAGSGRWSEAGNAVVLTDSNPADTHAANGATLAWCAYDATCTGLPEATEDSDNLSTNQVTAIISQVAAGGRGTVSFQVNIDAGLPASFLVNTAEQEYNDGNSLVPRTSTNPVTFEVLKAYGVITNGSSTTNTDLTAEPITVASVAQGGTVLFTDYVWNTGNGEDSFDLYLTNSGFPAGTSLQLMQADGLTPLLDTNGNGVPDTGNMNAGEYSPIVIRAQLPAGSTGGPWSVTLTAYSFGDDNQSNPALNTLSGVTSNEVDLTNNAAYVDASTPGAGPGPEANAVTENTVAPGGTTRFTLYVNNRSTVSDNYDLSASTDSGFSPAVLPAGWTVRFTDQNQKTLTNTGPIAPLGNKLIYADVTVPADAGPATTSLYFRVLSPVTSAGDIKHDAVTVGTVTDIVLEPDNQGQVLPGGIIVYAHWLSNQGNIDQAGITLTQTNDQTGWSSRLFEDTDGDGVLSAGDQPIDTVASLASGESKLIFAKVYAPATAPMGMYNLTTITATWSGGSVSAEDLTQTNRSDITITKQQALDSNCDGLERNFSYDGFAVEPGECVIYLLTATNTGTETMHNVRIQDATPSYTLFITSGGLPELSQGSLLTPILAGSDGEIIGGMGSLAPGDSATLIFGIEIE